MAKMKTRKKTSPRSKAVKTLKPRPGGARKTRRIGVFGGTFDPIHYGHLNSIESVLNDLKLDEVWVVPTSQNPLREKMEGPDPALRLRMARLALEGLNQNGEHYFVKSDEIDRGGLSYTVDTLAGFRKQEKSSEFFLILGADNIDSFSKWKDYKKILKHANVVFTSRPGVEVTADRESTPDWLKAEVKTLHGKKIKMKSGNYLYLVQLNDVHVSATEIRRKSRMKESISHLTPSAVESVIREHNLYQRPDKKIRDFVEFTKFCAKALSDKGALEIRAYDISQLSQPTEYTVVASGTSTRHAKALAEYIMRTAKEEYGIFPLGAEGLQEGRWVVLDYGALMVHVFYDFVRNEYRIEDLWARGNSLL